MTLKFKHIFFTTFFLVGLSHVSFSQNPAEGDTIWFRGKKIVLKKDFTWQFVEPKPAPAPKPTPTPTPERVVTKPEKVKDKDKEVVADVFACDSVFNMKWETNKIISFRDVSSAHSFPDQISVGKAVIPVAGRVYRGVSGGHKGMDVGLRLGDTVVAAFSGKIRHAAYNSGGFGNLVIIRHCNGMETYYAHLSKILVDINDEVKEGQVIGLGGSTGRSVSPHLHFEMRYLDRVLNPLEVFDFTTGDVIGNRVTIPEGGYTPSYVFNTLKNTEAIAIGEQDEEDATAQDVAPARTNTTPKPKPVQPKPQNNGNAKYHTLAKGENLSTVAKKYGTSVDQLCKMNGISKTTKIYAGKKLRVK
jgi:murein DD-endopeptidase MepM/ murein hydrolase activator NlpD